MKLNNCLRCDSSNHTIKNTFLTARAYESWIKDMLNSTELYYIKICSDCGFTELYNAKVVEKNAKKNIRNTL